MSEGLLVVADEGRVLVYNRAAEELLDLAPDTLAVGAALSDLVGLPELSALLARAAESTDGQALEHTTLRLRGGGHVRANVTPMPGAEGSERNFLLLLKRIDPLEALRHACRELISKVSHDLRAPLAAIRGCAATLLGGALDDTERARRFVEMLEYHAERLGAVVDDLDLLADLDGDLVELDRRPVGIEAALCAAVEHRAGEAMLAGVLLSCSIGDPSLQIDADPGLLEQALGKLLEQSIRRARKGSRLVLAAGMAQAGPARESEWFVCIGVDEVREPEGRTNGSRALSEAIGDRIQNGASPTDAGAAERDVGWPLRLAMIKQIVELHGGWLLAEPDGSPAGLAAMYWPVRQRAAAGHAAAG